MNRFPHATTTTQGTKVKSHPMAVKRTSAPDDVTVLLRLVLVLVDGHASSNEEELVVDPLDDDDDDDAVSGHSVP